MSKTLITEAGQRLETWIEGQAFKGWDPFDALNSPLLKRLAFRNRRLGQVWVQALKRSPINFRPLLGAPKGYNPKAMGLFLASYLRKYLLNGRSADLERVRFFHDWLSANVSPGYSGACWGYNFDWPNRGFFAPAGTPTIVNTAFMGLAYCDLWKLKSGELAAIGDASILQTSRSACEFMLHDLNLLKPASDELCFSYTPLDKRYVHNANVLGAWLLAEVAVKTGEPGLKQAALASARYTARKQRSNGSWLYGEGSSDHWVDNFHTGYVLVALQSIQRVLGIDEFSEVIRKGYAYWKASFFQKDGTPRYYPDNTYPIDIHSVSQAILTYLAFSGLDSEAYSEAQRIALWTIQNMQSPEGYFFYQINRWYRIRIPYMRWAQAWMFRALTELEWVMQRENLG